MQSRRTAIQSLAAVAAGLAIPPARAAAQPVWRKPGRLRPGDTVGLIEPAGFTDDEFDLAVIKEAIAAMGLVAKPAPHLLARYGYLAGKDRERAADVNAMFADDKVRAVFAVRGGWGSARILPYLNYDLIRATPKLLVGFSDITALHMALAARAGFTTIHGPNAASAWGELSRNSFRSIAFGGETPLYSSPAGTEDRLVQRSGRTRTFRPGKASGRLLGGNLTVLTSLMGTPYLPDFTGAILFIEDIDEAEYRIDRMLTQLALGGLLGRVAGVVFGQCTDCRARGPSIGGFTLSQVLQQHLESLGVPAFQGALFGHVPNQFSLPVGIRAEIDAGAGTIRILEPAVA
ncbi:MAG: Muramoyltetrapeptide carboxypeptidase [uncultured Sphingosinicella sp.]|uniref:Muramoyltetrapeptide carboxypeptidase n=1 Tax=uncultured Sphingosinicella sp. TaxID=478748 RepID=A0A6J4TZH4_9SPHN|nr:LD-carboxypeptidase [uncultured Sphingosinicella sp.]CAA9536024.1 MAG: Muramoyltetrapeptide carboxypeptidase [uncultured Sphingosinicella sp.]